MAASFGGRARQTGWTHRIITSLLASVSKSRSPRGGATSSSPATLGRGGRRGDGQRCDWGLASRGGRGRHRAGPARPMPGHGCSASMWGVAEAGGAARELRRRGRVGHVAPKRVHAHGTKSKLQDSKIHQGDQSSKRIKGGNPEQVIEAAGLAVNRPLTPRCRTKKR